MPTNVMVARDGVVKLGPTVGGVTVECQITNATITATPDPKEATTLCGKVSVPGVTAYVLHLEFLQDWTTGTGISDFLFANDGALVQFSLQPTAATTPGATGNVYVSPGDFGGAAGEIMVATVDLGLDGKPDITSATTTAATATTAAPEAEVPAEEAPPADDLVTA